MKKITLTKGQIKLLLNEMENYKVDEIHMDVDVDLSDDTVEAIDFDIWVDGKFIATVVTSEPIYFHN